MTKEEIIEIISKEYCPLSPECKAEFRALAEILTCEKGDILVKEGRHSDKTFFIVQGCARAYYIKEGKDISDWFAFENDFISSINSFFLNIPSPHAIEVLEPSLLLAFSRDNVNALSDKYRDFERLTKVVVTKTMLQQQERIFSLQFESAEQKYENILSIKPDITQRIPLTHIASYIGITLETLSRIRKPKKRI